MFCKLNELRHFLRTLYVFPFALTTSSVTVSSCVVVLENMDDCLGASDDVEENEGDGSRVKHKLVDIRNGPHPFNPFILEADITIIRLEHRIGNY